MTTDYEALAEAHRRLRVAAQAVVDGAEGIGNAEHPRCALESALDPQPAA